MMKTGKRRGRERLGRGAGVNQPSTWRSGTASSARRGTSCRAHAPARDDEPVRVVRARAGRDASPRRRRSAPSAVTGSSQCSSAPCAAARLHVGRHRLLGEQEAAVRLEHEPAVEGRASFHTGKRRRHVVERRAPRAAGRAARPPRARRGTSAPSSGPALQAAGRDEQLLARQSLRARATARSRAAAAARTTGARGRRDG